MNAAVSPYNLIYRRGSPSLICFPQFSEGEGPEASESPANGKN